MRKRQLHASGLDLLSKCGEQFRRRYVEGEKIAPGIASMIGTGVHASVRANLTKRILTGELMHPEEVADLARDTFVAEWKKTDGPLETDEDIVLYGRNKAMALSIDKSIRLAMLHRRWIAPSLNPTHLERPWVLDIAGLPFELAGTLDVQERLEVFSPESGVENPTISVRDTKTSGKTPSAAIAEESNQLTMYALAVYKMDGHIPETLALDYLIDNKTPIAKTFRTTRQFEDFQPLMRRIEAATLQIDAGIFQPARESDWWCSPKWCGFHRTCKYVRRPVSVAVPELGPQLVKSIEAAK